MHCYARERDKDCSALVRLVLEFSKSCGVCRGQKCLEKAWGVLRRLGTGPFPGGDNPAITQPQGRRWLLALCVGGSFKGVDDLKSGHCGIIAEARVARMV